MAGKEKLNAYKTICFREVRRFSRIWIQTILPSVITTVLYFVIFGQLLGAQLPAIGGYRFIDYIVPGLILMAVITNAYTNVASSFFAAKFQRNVEEMLVSPMPEWVLLAGFISGGIVRGMVVGGFVFLASLPFTTLPLHFPWLMLAVLFLTACLFALAGMINGIFAEDFDDITIIPTFVLAPLTYLGGIFYSLDMLPPFWQMVSYVNPILYMINAFRYGVLAVSDILPSAAIIMTIIMILLLVGVNMFLLKHGVRTKT